MKRKLIGTDRRVSAFAQAATQFCRIIERRKSLTKREFVHQCARAIPEVLVHLAPLYEVKISRKLKLSIDNRGRERITHEQWETLFKSIAAKLGKHDGYHEVFNPYVVGEDDPVYTCLSDDLADIYCDLKEGLRFYARGDELNVGAGALIWRRNMHVHTAEHCSGALRPLQRLIESYHEDDWF